MAKFKVLEAFELDGVEQEVGSVVELTDEQLAPVAEKVDRVEDGGNDSGTGEGSTGNDAGAGSSSPQGTGQEG